MPTVTAKRKKENITIGSAHAYIMEYTGDLPELTAICTDANRLGYIKGGASLEYTEETYTEKDDLGYVSKTITTDENAVIKLGLITWNGTTLQKLIDRCKVTEADGVRTIRIGGAGNAQSKKYVLCLHHEDKTDGDIWIMIVGRNTAGATITLATDSGSLIEPEFTAEPHDTDGTLIRITEETGTAE